MTNRFARKAYLIGRVISRKIALTGPRWSMKDYNRKKMEKPYK